MKKIFKYPLTGPQTGVVMPDGAKILAVQSQDNTPCVWALVDPERPAMLRQFVIVGTGHPIDDDALTEFKYLGTCQLPKYGLVWHVFEQFPPPDA